MSFSALHDKLQQWSIAGVFTKIWQRGLAEYDELRGIARTWQAADSASNEARLTRKPTGPKNRRIGKKAPKRQILVDENGIPTSLLVSAANHYDSVALEHLLKAAVVLPATTTECHLYLKGYVGKEEVAQCNSFIPHVRP